MVKFNTIHNLLVVSERSDGSVIIGSREKIADAARQQSPTAFSVPTTLHTDATPIKLSTLEAKTLLMHLAHRRLLPSNLLLEGLTDEEATAFQLSYDVALTKHDHYHILL
jgi:hypothetical protein